MQFNNLAFQSIKSFPQPDSIHLFLNTPDCCNSFQVAVNSYRYPFLSFFENAIHEIKIGETENPKLLNVFEQVFPEWM